MSEKVHLTIQYGLSSLNKCKTSPRKFSTHKVSPPYEPLLLKFRPEIVDIWNNIIFLKAFIFPHHYNIGNVKHCQHNVSAVYFWLNIRVEIVFLSNILFKLIPRHRKHSRPTRKRVHTLEIIPHVNVKIMELHYLTYMIFPCHKKQ
jgi:hypothetical protein